MKKIILIVILISISMKFINAKETPFLYDCKVIKDLFIVNTYKGRIEKRMPVLNDGNIFNHKKFNISNFKNIILPDLEFAKDVEEKGNKFESIVLVANRKYGKGRIVISEIDVINEEIVNKIVKRSFINKLESKNAFYYFKNYFGNNTWDPNCQSKTFDKNFGSIIVSVFELTGNQKVYFLKNLNSLLIYSVPESEFFLIQEVENFKYKIRYIQFNFGNKKINNSILNMYLKYED